MAQKKTVIEFYKSAIWPRCMLVDRELTKIMEENPWLKVVKIDILTNPRHALKNGIRMIPALKAGDEILSGIFLSSQEIKQFIDKIQKLSTGA